MYATLKLSYFPFLNGNKMNDAAAFIKYGDCASEKKNFFSLKEHCGKGEITTVPLIRPVTVHYL